MGNNNSNSLMKLKPLFYLRVAMTMAERPNKFSRVDNNDTPLGMKEKERERGQYSRKQNPIPTC